MPARTLTPDGASAQLGFVAPDGWKATASAYEKATGEAVQTAAGAAQAVRTSNPFETHTISTRRFHGAGGRRQRRDLGRADRRHEGRPAGSRREGPGGRADGGGRRQYPGHQRFGQRGDRDWGDRRAARPILRGSDRAIRRRVKARATLGISEKVHALALEAYDRMIGLGPGEISVDGCIAKAPSGGERAGRSPVDRGKQGLKRSAASEACGVPLGIVSDGANRHDSPTAPCRAQGVAPGRSGRFRGGRATRT